MWWQRLKPGKRIRLGRITYRFISIVGEGLTAEVWRGERTDENGERQVAIKILKSDQPKEMLVREFAVLNRINSYICPEPYEIIEISRRPALVMEWIEGVSLIELVRGKKSVDQFGQIIIQDLVLALAHLKRTDTYHGDLNPRNILIDTNGRMRFIDFGHFEDGDSKIIGTPEFMAPERWQNAPADLITDYFSAAALINWMCPSDFDSRLGAKDRSERKAAWEQKAESETRTPGKLNRHILIKYVRELKYGPRETTRALIFQRKKPRLRNFRSAQAACLSILAAFAPVSARVSRIESAITVGGDCWVRVSVDGKDLGYSPLRQEVATGEHKITLKTLNREQAEKMSFRSGEEVLILTRFDLKGCHILRKVKPSS